MRVCLTDSRRGWVSVHCAVYCCRLAQFSHKDEASRMIPSDIQLFDIFSQQISQIIQVSVSCDMK